MTTRTIQSRALLLAFVVALTATPLTAWAGSYVIVTRVLAASGTVTGGSINCHNNSGACLASFSAPATFTAVPDSGYAIDHWSGCTASSDLSTCSVPGTASLAIYVYFKSAPLPPPPPNVLDVRILAASGGVTGGTAPNLISCYNNTGTCKMTLSGPVTLTAMPDAGYTVASWSGCTSSPDLSTCSVPGTANTTVSVSFQTAPPPPPTYYTLASRILAASGTVTASGINNTSINCDNNSGSCSAQEPIGGAVTLTATPAQGFAVQSWSGCTPSAGLATCTVTLNSNTAVDTRFVAQQVCSLPNGTGTQTWDSTTNDWGPCTATTCDAGYALVNGTCTQRPTVLLVGAEFDSILSNVKTGLLGTGTFSTVDTFNTTTGTPTIAQLSGYSAVLVWSNYSPVDPVALGNVLADYFDAGGNVVLAQYMWSRPGDLAGRFGTISNGYVLLGKTSGDWYSGAPRRSP